MTPSVEGLGKAFYLFGMSGGEIGGVVGIFFAVEELVYDGLIFSRRPLGRLAVAVVGARDAYQLPRAIGNRLPGGPVFRLDPRCGG